MKIVQIGGTYVGAQKEIETAIHHYLRDHRADSRILYTIGDSDDPDVVRYETGFLSILRRGLVKLFGKRSGFAFLGTQRIIRYLDKCQPDVVHLHVIHHTYIDYQRLFRYIIKKKIPVVYTMHDLWAGTGGCYYYSSIQCTQLEHECRNCPAGAELLDCRKSKTHEYYLMKEALFRRFEKLALVSVSDWVNQELERTCLRQFDHRTILNAYSLPMVWEGSQTLPKTRKYRVIGVAANWDARKGFRDFLTLSEMLGRDYEVVLVGNIPNCDLPDNVMAVGLIKDKSELLGLYSASDIHVSMSREETFGLTFVEAAVVGTRSMAFNKTAIPEVLKRLGGIVVSECSVSQMAEAVKQFCASGETLKMTEREVRRIREDFSELRMAQEYYNLYRELLDISSYE